MVWQIYPCDGKIVPFYSEAELKRVRAECDEVKEEMEKLKKLNDELEEQAWQQ